MKKLLLFISTLLSVNAIAQINPDQNFDQPWVTNTNYPASEPAGWISTNVLTNSFASASNPTSVTQSTLTCSGSTSMRVETHKFTLGMLTGFLPDTCGFAFTGGVLISISPKLVDGFPYNQKPTQITYCYKAEPMAGDTAGVGVLLWKFNGTNRTYIGGGVNKYTTTTASMTNATLNIAYTSTLTPDSMSIYVGSSYKFPSAGTSIRKGAIKGSVIYVDNFSYPASTVGVKELKKEMIQLSAYPNPARTELTVSTESTEARTIEITDLTGRVIDRSEFAYGKVKLNVSKYNAGLYIYSVYDMHKNSLSTGKFTVTH